MTFHDHQPSRQPSNDRVLVVGGGNSTIDLVRLATVRTDDVVVVSRNIDDRLRRLTSMFAVETRNRTPRESDIAEASLVLVNADDVEVENEIVRIARRRGVPVHVRNRPLVSDFEPMEMLERLL